MDLTKPSTPISNDINIQSLDIQKDNNTLKLDIKLKIIISCTAVFCLLTIILLIISTSNTETINNTVTTVSPSNQDINHMLKKHIKRYVNDSDHHWTNINIIYRITNGSQFTKSRTD